MHRPWLRRVAAFVAAVLLAVIWGAIAQTQFNLAELQALGAPLPLALRWRTTLQDLLGFGPVYAALVAAGFALALPLAARLARWQPRRRSGWFALAGFVALIVAIRSVDALVPPPVLIAATRSVAGLLTLAVGGALGGALYARLTRLRDA